MAAEPTATEAAASDEGQVAPPIDNNNKPKNRLSDEEVQWILSRERQEFAPDTSDYPPESVEILNRGTEAFHVLSDNFAEFQEEVSAEYEAKGYVEVDDDYFERREEHRQSMREELANLFDGIDFSGITFRDRWYYNNLDEEDEDGEEQSYCNSEDESESEGEEKDDGDSEDEHESEGEEENDGEEDEYEQKGAEGAEEEEVPPGSKST